MTSIQWNLTASALPPVGVKVRTMSEGGIEQTMIYDNNLWWLPDKSMYVYYTPQFWKPLDES